VGSERATDEAMLNKIHKCKNSKRKKKVPLRMEYREVLHCKKMGKLGRSLGAKS
jgi:hypothetical protein